MVHSRGNFAHYTLASLTFVFCLLSLFDTARCALPPLGDINTLCVPPFRLMKTVSRTNARPRRFVLGDSYSATGFDPSKGYDQWAQAPDTFSSGRSWSMYIANSTRVPSALYDRTFSLAEGGRPLSPDHYFPGYPKGGMSAEVDLWEKYFVNASTEGKGARPVWTGDRTLFGACEPLTILDGADAYRRTAVIWFGVNDFEIAGRLGDLTLPLTDGSFDRLRDQLTRLYNLGGA